MRYMLLIYSNTEAYAGMSDAAQNELLQAYLALADELTKSGVRESGESLQPITTATTLRVRNGKHVTTDGPVAEPHEQLAGYCILNCKNLDEALEYAASIPAARFGAVEIRPIQEMRVPDN